MCTAKENEAGKRIRSDMEGSVKLSHVIVGGCADVLAESEQRPEGHEKVNITATWEKSLPGRGMSQCKGWYG
jgi:hypothetical protein